MIDVRSRWCGVSLLALAACSRTPESDGSQPSARPVASVVPTATASSRPSPPASATAQPGAALAAFGIPITKVHEQQRFSWRQVQGLNWQAVATSLPALPAQRPVASGPCPTDMLPVDGTFVLDSRGRDDSDEVLLAQNGACTRWMTEDRSVNGLCVRFDREAWQSRLATFPRKTMRYCVDRYEFPNAFGEFPLVVVRYVEAQAYCKAAGKRLCTETEWTFACEGEDAKPFPYGYEVDKEACRIDVLAAGAPKGTYEPRTLPSTARGIDIAWQGRRSGESPRCVSPFGVEDMTGNVDEWTESARKYGYRMILMGGHWGPGRHRCRPQTRGHGPMYVRHDQGFRCCRDLDANK